MIRPMAVPLNMQFPDAYPQNTRAMPSRPARIHEASYGSIGAARGAATTAPVSWLRRCTETGELDYVGVAAKVFQALDNLASHIALTPQEQALLAAIQVGPPLTQFDRQAQDETALLSAAERDVVRGIVLARLPQYADFLSPAQPTVMRRY